MPGEEILKLDRCTGKQLRELLTLASIDPNTDTEWLLEVGDREQMQALLDEMSGGRGQSGAALQAVCSPDTALESLVIAKRIAKRLAASATGAAQNAAATLLYHLAVAAALARHGENISSNPPAERLPLYRNLAAELPDAGLAAIFEEAVSRMTSAKPPV